MTDTPPLHPMERDRLRGEPTLVVTVRSTGDVADDVCSSIEALEAGEADESPPTIAFESYDDLLATLSPRALDLIEAVRREAPASINETARMVDRDVKNVHEELSRLARQGFVYFEEEGRRKRPVVWFDELVIALPFGSEGEDVDLVA